MLSLPDSNVSIKFKKWQEKPSGNKSSMIGVVELSKIRVVKLTP